MEILKSMQISWELSLLPACGWRHEFSATVPAPCLYPAITALILWNQSPNNLFLLPVALVLLFHHSDRAAAKTLLNVS